EAGGEIAFGDGDRLETRRRRLRIVVWRRLAVVDLHLCRAQRVAVLVREQDDRLGDVADLDLRQRRLVVVDQRDDVATGNVGGADDREARCLQIRPDVDDAAGRNRRPDRAAVQQTGKGVIVDVARGAGHLVDALLAKDVAANRSGDAHHRAIIRDAGYAVFFRPLFFNRRASMVTTAASSLLSAPRVRDSLA